MKAEYNRAEATRILLQAFQIPEDEFKAIQRKLERMEYPPLQNEHDVLHLGYTEPLYGYLCKKSQNPDVRAEHDRRAQRIAEGEALPEKVWRIGLQEELAGPSPWRDYMGDQAAMKYMLRTLFHLQTGYEFDEQKFVQDYRDYWNERQDFEGELQIPLEAYRHVREDDRARDAEALLRVKESENLDKKLRAIESGDYRKL